MGYRKVGYFEQIRYVIKYAISSWVEWNDAKYWAKYIRPSWLYLATKSRNKEVRRLYRGIILKAYRGTYYE